MTERRTEIDCESLKNLVEDLHPNTTLKDLDTNELLKIFPEIKREYEIYGPLATIARNLDFFNLNPPLSELMQDCNKA